MKKLFIILFGVSMLTSCILTPSNKIERTIDAENSVELVLKLPSDSGEDLVYHLYRFTFTDENEHEWYIFFGSDEGMRAIVHSPECTKCNTHVDEVKETNYYHSEIKLDDEDPFNW